MIRCPTKWHRAYLLIIQPITSSSGSKVMARAGEAPPSGAPVFINKQQLIFPASDKISSLLENNSRQDVWMININNPGAQCFENRSSGREYRIGETQTCLNKCRHDCGKIVYLDTTDPGKNNNFCMGEHQIALVGYNLIWLLNDHF